MSSTVAQVDMANWTGDNVEQERPGSVSMDASSSSSSSSSGSLPGEGPSWGNLNPDALAEVFSHVPFEDRMKTVPLVCRGWRSASSYASCWKYLDTEEWFLKRAGRDYLWVFECEETVERVVMMAVDKSAGQLLELRTRHITDAAVEYLADRCPSLTVLAVPNSLYTTDESITKLAAKCPNLQELDLSDCCKISNQALEAVGRHCKSLVWLGRNMLQTEHESTPRTGPVPGGDEEAIVVSKYMVKLKHLEMKNTSLSDLGLAQLARGCGQLQSLNLAFCTHLTPRALQRVTDKCPNIVDFTKPNLPMLHVDSRMLRFLFG